MSKTTPQGPRLKDARLLRKVPSDLPRAVSRDSTSGATMRLASKPRHAADFLVQQFEDEILLFNSHSDTVILLNQTAALVWLLCDGERSVVDMIDLLRETYPLETERLPSDVAEAIELLSGHGVIVIE